jgi:hypothetical protein
VIKEPRELRGPGLLGAVAQKEKLTEVCNERLIFSLLLAAYIKGL